MGVRTCRKPPFDNRVVGFIDILGFKDVVKRMDEEPRFFATIRNALKGLDKQALLLQKYRLEGDKKRQSTQQRGIASLLPIITLHMTAFSDCYVLSENFPALFILPTIQTLASRLLEEGILTRGAVVQGRAYHRGRVLFGPAIIEAHELESKVAHYPRILVTDEVLQAVGDYHTAMYRGQLLKPDVDGCWFVNLLVPPVSKWKALAEGATKQDSHSYLETIRKSLVDLLRYAQGMDEKISERKRKISKIQWLID
jgi:hypothetical protein